MGSHSSDLNTAMSVLVLEAISSASGLDPGDSKQLASSSSKSKGMQIQAQATELSRDSGPAKSVTCTRSVGQPW